MAGPGLALKFADRAIGNEYLQWHALAIITQHLDLKNHPERTTQLFPQFWCGTEPADIATYIHLVQGGGLTARPSPTLDVLFQIRSIDHVKVEEAGPIVRKLHADLVQIIRDTPELATALPVVYGYRSKMSKDMVKYVRTVITQEMLAMFTDDRPLVRRSALYGVTKVPVSEAACIECVYL